MKTKNMFRAVIMAVCAVFFMSACQSVEPDEIDTTEESGLIVGSWKLQLLTVQTETVINGSTHTTSSSTDFTMENCRLVLGKRKTATAQFNLETEVGTYTFNPETSCIRFKNGLSVSNNGKAMVLVGEYDVVVDDVSMVLIQKDLGVSLGSLLSSNERAVYSFRREKDKNE